MAADACMLWSSALGAILCLLCISFHRPLEQEQWLVSSPQLRALRAKERGRDGEYVRYAAHLDAEIQEKDAAINGKAETPVADFSNLSYWHKAATLSPLQVPHVIMQP